MSRFKKDRAIKSQREPSKMSKVDVVLGHASGMGLIDPASLRTDGDTQSRVQMDEATIAEYAEKMVVDEVTGEVVDPDGHPWPHLEALKDEDGELWLVDGFHRRAAVLQAGLKAIQVRIKPGTQRDAIRESFAVNAKHGKRRTRRDLHRNIRRALLDEVWGKWSDSRIAEMCRTTQPTVSKQRAELEANGKIPFYEVLEGSGGYEHARELPEHLQPREHPEKRSSPDAPAENEARRSRSKEKEGWAHQLARGDFSRLGALIVYPEAQQDYDVLAAHAKAALAKGGFLVVPVAGGQESLLGGLMALCEATGGPFAPPQPVYVKDFGRLFWVYGSPELLDRVPLEVKNASALLELAPESTREVLGSALDTW